MMTLSLSPKMITRSVVAATSSFHRRRLCYYTKFAVPSTPSRVVSPLVSNLDDDNTGPQHLPTILQRSSLRPFSTKRSKSTLPFTRTEEYPKKFLNSTVGPITSAKKENEADDGLSLVGNDDESPMRLSPDVPSRARTVQVRGTNRRSVTTQYLRACSVDVNYDYRSWADHNGPWRNIDVWSP